MDSVLQFWPIFIFFFSLFIGTNGVAIGLTMWVMGKLAEQDAKRLELKEAILFEMRTEHSAILKEVRERSHSLASNMTQQHTILDEKVDDMTERLARVETTLAWVAGGQDYGDIKRSGER